MRANGAFAVSASAAVLATALMGQAPSCPAFPADVAPGCAAAPPSPALAPLFSAITERILLGPGGAIEIYSKLAADDQEKGRACLRIAAAQQANYIMRLYLQGDELNVVGHLSTCASELYQETDRIGTTAGSLPDNDWLARADFFQAWMLLLSGSNRSLEALDLLRKSIELNPDDVYHWNAVGFAYLQQYNYDCAAAGFERAANGAIQTNCDQAIFKAGRNDAVQGHGASGKEQEWIYPQANLALVAIEKGDYEKAYAVYEKLIQRSADAGKQFAYLDYNLALLLQQLGDRKTADARYREALKTFSEREASAARDRDSDLAAEFRRREAEVYNALGALASSTGRADEAESHYRKALTINPWLSAARYNLGLLQERRGRRSEAIANWQETVKSDPDFVPAHLALAREFSRTGSPEEAIAHYRAVLDKAPQFEEALIGLGDQLAAQHRVEDACREYRQAAPGKDFQRLGHARRTLCSKKAASTGVEPGAGIR